MYFRKITDKSVHLEALLIRAEDNTYVSQLTVSVSAQMVGTNISCSHDSKGTHLIGSLLLTLTTGNASVIKPNV